MPNTGNAVTARPTSRLLRRLFVDGVDSLASDPRSTNGQPDGWGWDWERWRVRLALLLLLLLPTAAAAQVGPDAAVRDALAWAPDHQHAADVVSTVLVGVALASPCLFDRTWRCVGTEGLRVGVGLSVAEVVKRATHRTRPNSHDDKSFFSGHTMLACVATVHTKAWALCPAVGYLRIAADYHWSTDVATGAMAGALLTTITWGK